jgi:hypothetical protein
MDSFPEHWKNAFKRKEDELLQTVKDYNVLIEQDKEKGDTIKTYATMFTIVVEENNALKKDNINLKKQVAKGKHTLNIRTSNKNKIIKKQKIQINGLKKKNNSLLRGKKKEEDDLIVNVVVEVEESKADDFLILLNKAVDDIQGKQLQRGKFITKPLPPVEQKPPPYAEQYTENVIIEPSICGRIKNYVRKRTNKK